MFSICNQAVPNLPCSHAQSGSFQPHILPIYNQAVLDLPCSQCTNRQFSTSHVLNVASPQASPRFYLAAVEKNQEKAWEQNYIMIGNGGLDQFNPPWCFSHSYRLRRYQVTNKRCVGTSGRRFVCTLKGLTRKQQPEGKGIKSSVCTWATIKEAQSQG